MRVLELRYYLGVEARDGTDAELQRVASDPAFGEALLREGIDTMLARRRRCIPRLKFLTRPAKAYQSGGAEAMIVTPASRRSCAAATFGPLSVGSTLSCQRTAATAKRCWRDSPGLGSTSMVKTKAPSRSSIRETTWWA
jgi:hypothetical protein